MEILNRSAIRVVPTKIFVDWANKLEPSLPIEINILGEAHTYLTNPDFQDPEKHVKKYFKQIFIEELSGIWLDENDWPQKRDFKTFCKWFTYEVSDWVQDLSNKPLFDEF